LIHEATDFEFADDWGMLPPININNYLKVNGKEKR